MQIISGAMVLAVVCILAPSAYTLLSIAGMAPMTVPIFLGWLAWLQAIHVVGAVLIWPRRHRLSTRVKAALLSWGGLAFWYWLPAPVYFLLTMHLDRLQLQWTALAFFWEVPVVGGAFVLAAQRLYPSRRRLSNDPARRYRAVMRYPTVVGSLLFVFTLLGYTLGALQLRVFTALPLVEQIKNVGNGVVISLLLAVFYHLGLDRVLEPVRSQIAREGGLGTIVVQHLPEGVLLLEPDGRVAIANDIGRAHLPFVAARGAGGEVTGVDGLPLAHLLAWQVEPREIAQGERRFQVAAQPLEHAQGAVLVIRDVTREREAQQVAQRQARLAAVGQLAAGIAHDFNNILMTIVNSAELAQRKYGDTGFGKERLGIIVEQGERAAALVRQILDFSRQSEPALETVSLGALLEQTVGLLERTLPETIRVVLEPPDGDFLVTADPHQLSQALTNLAVNARDAVALLGGELRFRLGRQARAEADEDAPGPGAWITLRVSDTGPGMPPEVRERIFEPFFTTKAPGSGTGLGLSQAYGIISQHRGHIAVESRRGEGTTFTIYLPDEGGRVIIEDTAGAEITGGRGETLLVVEDEAPVRQSLALILGELNYEVLTATCAEQALELHAANAERIALVLTDLVMPGMGGVRLVRELRQRGAQMPVVMMSGYVDESSRGSVDGVSAWVQKPVRARRLGTVIHEALSARAS